MVSWVTAGNDFHWASFVELKDAWCPMEASLRRRGDWVSRVFSVSSCCQVREVLRIDVEGRRKKQGECVEVRIE